MSVPNTDYKILIVEDDGLICEDISSLLLSQGYTISGVAHNGMKALDMLTNRQPDFALLDINLGTGMSGIDIAQVIHDKHKIPFIFLTSYDDEATLNEAQEHSPFGYIVKPFQDRTLLTTIKMALFNHNAMKDKEEIDQEAIERKTKVKFTKQEFIVLNLLLDGLSYKLIGEKLFISVNTVKHHIKNLYSKLEINSRSELYKKLF